MPPSTAGWAAMGLGDTQTPSGDTWGAASSSSPQRLSQLLRPPHRRHSVSPSRGLPPDAPCPQQQLPQHSSRAARSELGARDQTGHRAMPPLARTNPRPATTGLYRGGGVSKRPGGLARHQGPGSFAGPACCRRRPVPALGGFLQGSSGGRCSPALPAPQQPDARVAWVHAGTKFKPWQEGEEESFPVSWRLTLRCRAGLCPRGPQETWGGQRLPAQWPCARERVRGGGDAQSPRPGFAGSWWDASDHGGASRASGSHQNLGLL